MLCIYLKVRWKAPKDYILISCHVSVHAVYHLYCMLKTLIVLFTKNSYWNLGLHFSDKRLQHHGAQNCKDSFILGQMTKKSARNKSEIQSMLSCILVDHCWTTSLKWVPTALSAEGNGAWPAVHSESLCSSHSFSLMEIHFTAQIVSESSWKSVLNLCSLKKSIIETAIINESCSSWVRITNAIRANI